MATILSCPGQHILVNLDNVDFIRKTKDALEFYRSNRTKQEEKPTFVAIWQFQSGTERDLVVDKILYDFGHRIPISEDYFKKR